MINEELRNKQKIEAIERLKILQRNYLVHKNVLKEYKENETIYYSENFGGYMQGILYWLKNKDEFVNIVKNIEEKRNIYVYHCILNHYRDDGDVLTMLYISADGEFWKEEQKELKDGCPCCYVYSFSFPVFSEFGSVEITGVNGGINRLY